MSGRVKRLELAFRRAVAWLGARLARRPRSRDEAIRRILVIRVDERVGNVLLTTPLIRSLQGAFADARVDVLVAAGKRPVLDGVASTIPFDKRAFFRAPIHFLRALLQLRRARYDVAIDASHWHVFSTTSALLLAWTGAPIRVAHGRGEAKGYATDLVAAPTDPEPEIDTKLRLLGPLGVEATERRMTTALGHGPSTVCEDLRLRASGRPIVSLVPGSRKLEHRASAAVFVALAREAARLGAWPLVLWGPGEEALAESVARDAGAERAPPTDLAELAAVMRASAVVVSNDTGPMHLAVAVGTPTIAVFVTRDHRRWGHSEPPHHVVAGWERPDEDIVAEARVALADRLVITSDEMPS